MIKQRKDNVKPTLYLIRGVPGAGKTTFANMLNSRLLVDRVYEADQYFYGYDGTYKFDATKLSNAHEQCQRNTRKALSEGLSVAVSNTSCAEWEVETYQNIASEYDANFVSIIVENRNCNDSVHNVPIEKIEQMKKKFSIKL